MNSLLNRLKTVMILSLLMMTQPAMLGYAQTAQDIDEASPKIAYKEIIDNLESSLAAEFKSVTEIKNRTEKLRQSAETLSSVLNSYRIQHSSHMNLLYLPETKLDSLVNAAAIQKQTLKAIKNLKSEATIKLQSAEELQDQIAKRIETYDKHISEIPQPSSTETGSESITLETGLRRLIDLLNEKQQILSEMAAVYQKQVAQLEELEGEFVDQLNQFTAKIDKKRSKDRFTRKPYPSGAPIRVTLKSELQSIKTQIEKMPKWGSWIKEQKHSWRYGLILFTAAGLLYTTLVLFLYKIKRGAHLLYKKPSFKDFPWRSTAVRILYGSLLLIGTIVFIVAYARVRFVYFDTPHIQSVIRLLLIFLYTGWGLSLIDIWRDASTPPLPDSILRRLRLFVLVIRCGAPIYVVFDWFLHEDAVTLTLIRLVFEFFLIFWVVSFKKTWEQDQIHKQPIETRTLSSIERFLFGAAYGVVITPLVLEFVGYGSLAGYWLASWGHSLVVAFWAAIFFYMLREWDQKFYMYDGDVSVTPAHPIKWLIFKVCWLTWALSGILFLATAWVGPSTAFAGITRIVGYKIKIGEFHFSLMGLIYVFLILFFTHIAIRLWRHVLNIKILGKSGLETGLKNSIVSINTYILWGIGIIVALNAFGVSGTSLTVAFGAISIGLGFGMQNIFNNFISGLIMLFERPIQVGDAVEINGIWGDVKKINFRSTVVQTFDNASLIIPNSDFISNQVTNWSFRDRSLRVKIDVGVKYGSDIELVKTTLLEVAEKTPKVRKRPEPDVLFQDFGDSALVFTLRVWTDINNMFKVSTASRFEIDKAFREKGIGIPFPQRDLHLRSVDDSSEFDIQTV
jgi:potassium-dependent mechanosensitive channel